MSSSFSKCLILVKSTDFVMAFLLLHSSAFYYKRADRLYNILSYALSCNAGVVQTVRLELEKDSISHSLNCLWFVKLISVCELSIKAFFFFEFCSLIREY